MYRKCIPTLLFSVIPVMLGIHNVFCWTFHFFFPAMFSRYNSITEIALECLLPEAIKLDRIFLHFLLKFTDLVYLDFCTCTLLVHFNISLLSRAPICMAR